MVVLASLGATASSGCIGPTKTRGRVIGTMTAGVGTMLMVRASRFDCDQFDGEGEGEGVLVIGCGFSHGLELTVGGVVALVGAVILIANEVHSPAPAPEAVLSPVPVAAAGHPGHAAALPLPATADPMLRRLTLQASVAARAGHCSAVNAIAAQVERLDAAYRREGFGSDAVIVACLRTVDAR